jgi:hypothetical protein
MSLPRAELARPSWPRRLVRWLAARLSPPRALGTSEGFAAASYWSLTGALAAGFAVSLFVLWHNDSLWQASLPFTVGWAVVAVLGTIFWFWPFLLSYYMFQPLFRRIESLRRRTGGAMFGALWHAGAHCLLLTHLGADPWNIGLICPLVVGGLWGSWLPTASTPAR